MPCNDTEGGGAGPEARELWSEGVPGTLCGRAGMPSADHTPDLQATSAQAAGLGACVWRCPMLRWVAVGGVHWQAQLRTGGGGGALP